MNKRILAVASTPYHLFNLANIVNMDEYRSSSFDIIVTLNNVEKQSNALRIYKNVNTVKNVGSYYTRKEFSNKILRSIYLFIFEIKSICYAKNILKGSYDEILVSYPSTQMMSLLYAAFKFNKDILVTMYEDGIGSYNSFGVFRHGMTQKVMNWIYGFDFYRVLNKILIYQPNMLPLDSLPHAKKDKIISGLNKRYIDAIVCDYTDEIERYKKSKCIFFDQYFLLNSKEYKDLEVLLFNIIDAELTGNKTIFKMHPRVSSSVPEIKSDKLSHTTIPFELISSKIENIEEYILVTSNSTAVFTPKMVMDKEPFIIYIYPLFEGDIKHPLLDRLICSYVKKDKIKIVYSIEEYEKIVKLISNKV